jgi:similar to stage IV sporulation protein
MPLTLSQSTYTGESARRFYLVFGNRAIQITGYRQKKFESFTKQSERKLIQWRNWSLPFGWIKESVLESQISKQNLSREEAIKAGMDRAQAKILREAGSNAQIIMRKILHERLENGKVYIEAHFEVEQSIVQEQPIIQGE